MTFRTVESDFFVDRIMNTVRGYPPGFLLLFFIANQRNAALGKNLSTKYFVKRDIYKNKVNDREREQKGK
jgi:hypothetical protein